jgi:hypothetical protein
LGFDEFYYRFLRTLIVKRLTLLDILSVFTRQFQQENETGFQNNNKPLRHMISLSIARTLNKPTDPQFDKHKIKYYFAFLGFLYLSYIPRYTYKEILDILQKEGADSYGIQMAAKLIGAYYGYDKLNKDGLIISNNIKQNITKVLSGYMGLIK